MYSFNAIALRTYRTSRLEPIHGPNHLNGGKSAYLPNFLISSILRGGYTSAAHAKPT